MNLTAINSAIEVAYANALANGGQRVMPHAIEPNVTIQTDEYTSISGDGFRVVCIIKGQNGASVIRVKNYGPDTNSEKEWPSEGVEVALQNMPPPLYSI
jgi:hypothetical protein